MALESPMEIRCFGVADQERHLFDWKACVTQILNSKLHANFFSHISIRRI